MEQEQQPLVFPYNLIKMGKDLFERFKKKPILTIPVGAGLVGLVFYLLLMYMLESCLVTIIPPFLMLAIFWMLDIKRVKKLAIAGLLACAVMMLVETAFFVGVYTDFEPSSAYSDDANMVLRDGVVSPVRGDAETLFNYTVDVHWANTSQIASVRLLIIGLADYSNESMSLAFTEGNVTHYYYETPVSHPINQFVFWAEVNNTWYLASDYSDGETIGVMGPVYSDTWEVAKPLLWYSAIQAFVQFFAVYMLLVAMIWWTRRARRMREKALDKWETKRKEAAAEAPKDEAKVPSLAKAMGLEADDTFVCSECGADVPAEATSCPKCGERFD